MKIFSCCYKQKSNSKNGSNAPSSKLAKNYAKVSPSTQFTPDKNLNIKLQAIPQVEVDSKSNDSILNDVQLARGYNKFSNDSISNDVCLKIVSYKYLSNESSKAKHWDKLLISKDESAPSNIAAIIICLIAQIPIKNTLNLFIKQETYFIYKESINALDSICNKYEKSPNQDTIEQTYLLNDLVESSCSIDKLLAEVTRKTWGSVKYSRIKFEIKESIDNLLKCLKFLEKLYPKIKTKICEQSIEEITVFEITLNCAIQFKKCMKSMFVLICNLEQEIKNNQTNTKNMDCLDSRYETKEGLIKYMMNIESKVENIELNAENIECTSIESILDMTHASDMQHAEVEIKSCGDLQSSFTNSENFYAKEFYTT